MVSLVRIQANVVRNNAPMVFAVVQPARRMAKRVLPMQSRNLRSDWLPRQWRSLWLERQLLLGQLREFFLPTQGQLHGQWQSLLEQRGMLLASV
jgi:hypothetical protein